jgi:phytoene dehydrogenase-like protein
MKYDVVVVGGGIAGLTAAAYLAKRGKSVALFERQSKMGGLVQTFERNRVYFDGGLRSIENSGIVFPMLRQLGIEVEFVKSAVSVGIGKQVLVLRDAASLKPYEEMLKATFPENTEDVAAIVREIKKIMGYMDVLYGIDNPTFLDPKKNAGYFAKVVLPWMFKFLATIRKINRLNEPIESYLTRFTSNQALIDLIAQHFFQQTPTSFALSYFSVYLDYYYPKGGTATLIEKMEAYLVEQGGKVYPSTTINVLHPEEHYVLDANGNRTDYSSLIWAGDTKTLYKIVPLDQLLNRTLAKNIAQMQLKLQPLRGGDSVFSIYLTIQQDPSWFADICTGHFFYTPDTRGLTTVDKSVVDAFLQADASKLENPELKQAVQNHLRSYCYLNTFEIAIPALRDSSLAPEGQTGMVVSLLFDYLLAKKLSEFGWMDEFKVSMEQVMMNVLNESIFPGFKQKVSHCFSSTPLTIEKLTGNTEGGITGWAFTNPYLPAVNQMHRVTQSVKTILPNVYQAGQWTFSPSGLPISILTGKLAADKIR